MIRTVATSGRTALGIDPGRSAAVALVMESPSEGRPVLLWTASIYGANDRLWRERAEAHFKTAVGMNGFDPVDLAVLEVPANKGAGLNKSAIGPLMRFAGILEALAYRHLRAWPEPIESGRNGWPKVLGVPAGKIGEGLHRIDEMRKLIEVPDWWGGVMPTTEAGRERLVAQAEAALIALAGLRGVR